MPDKISWSHHLGYKWWEASRGTGKFAVQKMSKKNGWAVMRVPWFGPPQVITVCQDKKAAMTKAESYM